MSKAKRKNKKELVMQKRYWDQIKKTVPVPGRKNALVYRDKTFKKRKGRVPAYIECMEWRYSRRVGHSIWA